LKEAFRKIDEIPFDFERRRMSVVVANLVDGQEQHHELICKGAVEEVLAICTSVRTQEATDASLDGDRAMPTLPLDAALLARTQAVTAGLNAEGLRVVAVAVKSLPPDQSVYSVADESGLILIGCIAFLDPPKESAAPARKKLAAHGITVKVLTGDNDLVTAQVCRQVGLPRRVGDAVMLGSQVEALSDEALKVAAEAHNIFAKLTPMHKERIVRALHASGMWWASWATASTTRRPCARPTSASRWTARWISRRKPPTSSCWRRACWYSMTAWWKAAPPSATC